MNIGYHSDFMDRIIARADKRQERMEKMINKMLDKSEPILNAGKPKPMTNEEYLRSCTTEQLAEFLTKIILDDKRFRMTMVGGVNETKMWLKQPHHEKE